MQNALFFCALFALFISCKTAKPPATAITAVPTHISDTVQAIIRCTNLSEDMSALSSNDDELTLLLYDYKDSSATYCAGGNTVLNGKKMSDTLYFKNPYFRQNHTVIVFLVETDSDKSQLLISYLVQKHAQELMKAYVKKDYLSIEKYIGDDDLLGVCVITGFQKNMPVHIKFKDIHRMDRFDYSILLKN